MFIFKFNTLVGTGTGYNGTQRINGLGTVEPRHVTKQALEGFLKRVWMKKITFRGMCFERVTEKEGGQDWKRCRCAFRVAAAP